MSKRKALGQDPLSWIRKTDESEEQGVEAAAEGAAQEEPEPETAAEPQPEQPGAGAAEEQGGAAAVGLSAPRPTSSRSFLLVLTVDFLLLIILIVLAFEYLRNRVDYLGRQVVDQAQQIRVLEARRPAPAAPSLPSETP